MKDGVLVGLEFAVGMVHGWRRNLFFHLLHGAANNSITNNLSNLGGGILVIHDVF